MNSIELNQEERLNYGIYGKPVFKIPIGGEFQAEIPLQNEESHYPLYETNGHSDIGGSKVNAWTVPELESFLLGVYIFEKDFVQLNRFLESKRMRDILLFYYGTFYGTDEHEIWSNWRKEKNERSAYGEKLFDGMRQQELLSRLFLSVSDKCQHALSKVSKMYTKGKMPFEEYVFSLKEMVGADVLVQAVGVGKQNQDLTLMAVRPSTSNEVNNPIDLELPLGKAFFTLEPSEIMMFLMEDYRWSKARVDDLFWDAVWPRLLARGWQSEQAENKGEDSLIFLVPGVEKLSRRKLVKGKHYFDSIKDILCKVASKPVLLELNAGEGKRRKRNNDEETDNVNTGKDILRNNVDCKAPVTKRPRTRTARSGAKAKLSSIVPISEPELPGFSSGLREFSNDCVPPTASSQGKRSPTTSLQGLQNESVECAPATDTLDANGQGGIVIDLNIPYVLPDFGTSVFKSEEQDNQVIERRHSTRNRPPTARLLDAYANGHLTVNSRPRKEKRS